MIYDISPQITTESSVWPGDHPPLQILTMDFTFNNNVKVSSFHSTVHIGAHADAPCHYIQGGESIESVNLNDYIGLSQVITIKKKGKLLPTDIKTNILAPRILFNTSSFPNPNIFNKDFASLSLELIEFLSINKVNLVGIDTPSVDCFESKSLPCHHLLFKKKIAILEGLILSKVPDGIYELIALPLPLAGFDASPVRAILRKKNLSTNR